MQITHQASHQMISVIVPLYNEHHTLRILLKKLEQQSFISEIVVVDDCSYDGSQEILKEFTHRDKFEIIFLSKNKGKGNAIRNGLERVTNKYACIQDADLEYKPEEIERLAIAARPDTLIYGSRRLNHHFFNKLQLRPNYFCVTLLNLFTGLLYGTYLSDVATCYKLFPVKLVKEMQLQCERFEFCPELNAKAMRMGIKIQEIQVSYKPRSKKEGKKIGFKDAVEAFWNLWKYRSWNPKNLSLIKIKNKKQKSASKICVVS